MRLKKTSTKQTHRRREEQTPAVLCDKFLPPHFDTAFYCRVRKI